MTKEKVKSIISLLIVGSFVITATLLALIPVLKGDPAGAYTDHIKEFWALYSGVIGVIIGYYFGSNQDKD